MKKIILVFLTVLLVGCGSNDQKKTYQGVKTSSSNANYVEMGMGYLQKGDPVKAIQSFDNAIRQNPADPQAYLVLAQVYMRMEQFARAEDTLQAAKKVAPNNASVYYFLALSQSQQKDEMKKDSALSNAKKSAELFVQQKNEEGFRSAVSLVKTLDPTPAN